MLQKAIVCYQRAIQAQPDYAMAFAYLADVYYKQGNLEMAIRNYRRAITRDAEFFEAYNDMGHVLKDAGEVQEAIHCYHRNYAQAISCFNELLRINPMSTDGLVKRGNTYVGIGRVDEAIQDYKRAIAIRPTMEDVHALLASAYMTSGNVEAAIKGYRQTLMLCPDFPEATCNLLYTLQRVCDWKNREEMLIEVEGILRRQIEMSITPSVEPFQAIAYPLDPILALDISLKHAQYYSLIAARYSLSTFIHPPPLPIKGGGRNGRLRVGYVSSDFRNHPVSHLMGSVFGMHDRENIEVFCYALRPNGGTEWGIRIQSEAEHFIDVSSLTFDATARMINEDQIQILIDLNGYTKGARIEIFAMQPAPIQVSYMGFPGTTGATYIDYLLTDEFVSPMKYAHIYSEKLVHLPHCYFVNDYKQKYCDLLNSNCQSKRCDYGLPEDKFIFACFNQLYKMDPEIFITWCNILKRVPNSALWLLRFPAAGEMRLRAHAAAQGLQPDQIIFTDVVMKQKHIRRSSLADLFLDTPMCNAHTTGTDVLWAGLPMITLPLEKMATRVAGSLCLATGLGDKMIVSSMKEYEEKPVSLGLNRSKLQDLTNRLKAARMSCPLFDTTRWVRNLERSYFKMWNLYCSGQHPQPFKVTENDSEFPFNR
ncbi:hypothetical protein KY290_020117 [Solanum tuberosum]|uniref:protein O-GlcNAc transferase n=1 Tax=Solanum tuberosum TaxID=4113 RepID=A0ABQ7VJ03_SOLTU|nr:hypothetical protein KY284_018500 [Solanum tuberosum]KAH0764044.1 hypothetical protein KY290_020117 [Solanum tuberosum]